MKKIVLTFVLIAFVVLIAMIFRVRKPEPAAAEIESQFEQMMNGAVMVGHSTLDGKDGLSGEERYSIDHVSRLSGDMWMFQARMKLEGHEIPVPVPVTIKWGRNGQLYGSRGVVSRSLCGHVERQRSPRAVVREHCSQMKVAIFVTAVSACFAGETRVGRVKPN